MLLVFLLFLPDDAWCSLLYRRRCGDNEVFIGVFGCILCEQRWTLQSRSRISKKFYLTLGFGKSKT
jgi:hypothetical protein